jgi:hypothetical protein
MATLIANPLSNWHLPAIMKWTLGGGRSASESGLTPVWMMKDNSNSGEFWSGTKTSLLGTREN